MIDPAHDVSISRQAQILEISRSSVYYRPRPESPSDLDLMKAIDRLHLEAPIGRYRSPEIVNTDQRDRAQHGWHGSWKDNVFIERFWPGNRSGDISRSTMAGGRTRRTTT
jgi:hypothetical protein